MLKYYEVTKTHISLSSIVEQLVIDMRRNAEKKEITLTTQIEEGLPDVFACPKQLQDMLERLLDNAIKFTPGPGSVVVRCAREANDIVFSCSDAGIGIAPEEVSKIWNKFYQVDRTKTEQQGSGLGLYIAKRLAELNHCQLTCESEEGKGTTVTLKIPIAHSSS
jgi:two-component system phosphate regulon sensor histidine kinase PhoR